MRILGNVIQFTFISFLFCSCGNEHNMSNVQIKKLDYPSASSIEFYDGRLYLMGDDATKLLILVTNLNIDDSISIISYPDNRIPKDIKPDLEASALNGDNLLKTKENDSINFERLFLKIKVLGIEQINIEGACFVSGKLILVNRGNKGYPHNHFIMTDEKSLTNYSSFQTSIIPFEIQKDTTSFKGISGLCYAKESDQLVMTISTEDTRNSYDDGAIGKSFLWIINNISNKLDSKTLSPDKIIDLEEIDPRFKKQKIESATVISETNELINLALVADNDDGSSTIFKLSIKKV